MLSDRVSPFQSLETRPLHFYSAMPGVPTSRACNGCRKAKKKCDQAQPSCGRCVRLAILCVGNGVQRFKFQLYQPEESSKQRTESPRTGPSNETTRIRSALISILEIRDERYDIRYWSPHSFPNLPRRIGSDPAFDASMSALVATYNAIALRKPEQNALIHFGNALRAVRVSLQDPKRSVEAKMEFVVIMLICQQWIDRKHAGKHRGVMAHLLEEIVAQGRILEFDIHDVTAWCSHVIFESLANPNLKLGSWFWDASFQKAIMARPYRYGQSALISHELGMVGELAVYLRKPERYLYQLRCYYNILGTERPFMRGLVEQSMPLVKKPEERRMTLLRLSGYAGILSQAILVAPVLEAFGVHPSYVKDSHEFCDETILLAKRCVVFRPYGTFWMPELLKLAWASAKDCYRHKEVEDLIAEYEKDAEGSNFMEEARDIKARFDKLGWSKETELNPPEEEVEETPACVIL